MQQFFELERLGDEALGAQPRHFHGFAHAAEAGDHDRRDLRVAPERLVEHLPAVNARQPQVREQHVEREFIQPFERRLAGGRLLDAIPVFTQPFRDDLAEGVLVIDEQEMLGGSVRHCF